MAYSYALGALLVLTPYAYSTEVFQVGAIGIAYHGCYLRDMPSEKENREEKGRSKSLCVL